MLQQADEAGVRIYLDVGAVNTVGEDVEIVDQAEAPRIRQKRLHTVGQFANLVVTDATNLGQREPLPAIRAIDDHAVNDVERAGLGLQQHAGKLEDLLTQVPRRQVHRLSANGCGT